MPQLLRSVPGEVQEIISCREFEGVPQFLFFFPKEWGTKGVERPPIGF